MRFGVKTSQQIKTVVLIVLIGALILYGINFLCGLVVKNQYVAVDLIGEKTAQDSFGYFRPNQDKIILFPGIKPYKVNIDALGLRFNGWKKDLTLKDIEDKYKILAIGDSITFGLNIHDEDTYPYRLQEIFLNEAKEAVVLNAGIGSATITDYLYYLQEKGLALQPDLVIVNFSSNDLGEMERRVPLYQKIIEENRFEFWRTIKLTKFMRFFRKFGLQNRYRHWLKKIRDERVREILRTQSQTMDDVTYVSVYHYGKAVTDPYHEELKEKWHRYFAALQSLHDFLKEENINFLFIIHPDIVTVFDKAKHNYQDLLRHYLNQMGIAYVDPLPVIKARRHEYLKLYNQLLRDFHLSGYGNQILAEAIYNQIKDRIPK